MARTFWLVLLVVAPPVCALETDQYWAWGRPLADSTEAVNARFNLELERVLDDLSADRPAPTCRQISAEFRSRLRFVLLHDIQIWAWNSRWVSRLPDGAQAHRQYRATNLYSNHALIDPATWMPATPTIEVAGVRFGTDKLAHFVSSGWTYFTEYSNEVADGASPEDAERKAVQRGILEESLILGRLASGVLSIADIEAGFGGLRLYRHLCEADDPILALRNGRWEIARAIDLTDYVTPRWDESFQPPIYTARRWRTVRPVLQTYCDRLDDPRVAAQRRSYRARDVESPVGEAVREKVAAGRLHDPSGFGIEAVCGTTPIAGRPLGEDPPPVPRQPVAPMTMTDVVSAELADRRRFALGLAGFHLTYPQVVSASIAVMLTSQPTSYDCRSPCDFRGPFAELEPGLGGGKLGVGWARVSGSTNRGGSMLARAFIGVAYKLTLLRTWGSGGWLPGGRTYAGFEVGVPVAQANLGLGLLARVDSRDGGRWTVTGSIGWGF